MSANPQRLQLRLTVEQNRKGVASTLLAEASGLAKSRIKDAMNKGAVRLQRGKRWRVLRRATTLLKAGDKLDFNYDQNILAQLPLSATCIADEIAYSVWDKPAGMLAQGTVWGDHCSLLRYAETFFTPPRGSYLIHRLDKEARGLMLIAHQAKAAAALSQLFRQNRINKVYQAVVRGLPETQQEKKTGVIDTLLDGKSARTEYRLLSYDEKRDESVLEVTIVTGRRHQIRRHLAALGHPVMGDPVYGQGNKTKRGLQLVASGLAFAYPLDKTAGKMRHYQLALP